MILYELDYMHKHRPEWRDYSEPLLLGADHQLFSPSHFAPPFIPGLTLAPWGAGRPALPGRGQV